MANLIDWGGTPLANAGVRGIVAAIITGVIAAAISLLQGMDLEFSVLTGVTACLPLILWLLGYGAWDQKRVGDGAVNPADVPVQIESKLPVMGDFSGAKRVGGSPAAKAIAASWTAKYKAALGKR